MIDLVDIDLAASNWSARPTDCGFYAQGRVNAELVLLHRVVARRAGLDIEGLGVDHKDCDKLNCRRENLRAATQAQNNLNKIGGRGKSGVKGVSWHSGARKWRALITLNKQTYHLGYFDSKEGAAEAYRAASVELHGEFGRTG